MGVWSDYLLQQNQALADDLQRARSGLNDAAIAQMGEALVNTAPPPVATRPVDLRNQSPAPIHAKIYGQLAEAAQREQILEHLATEWILSQQAFKSLALKYGKQLGKTYAQVIEEAEEYDVNGEMAKTLAQDQKETDLLTICREKFFDKKDLNRKFRFKK